MYRMLLLTLKKVQMVNIIPCQLYEVVGLFSLIKWSELLFFFLKKEKEDKTSSSERVLTTVCPFYQISFHPYDINKLNNRTGDCCYNLMVRSN